ncbi:MAG: Ig-like domain-containing protein, partial [Bacillota bacterium]
FEEGGTAISGFASMAFSRVTELCSNSSLAAGSHSISGAYSGDATYGAGVVGPITQTVTSSTGSSGTSLTTSSVSIATSKSQSRAGQNVTFTVSVVGSSPTGTVQFLDGATAITGCASIALSSGVARCSTKALSVGVHSISGLYSGDANNTSGTGGPITQTVH